MSFGCSIAVAKDISRPAPLPRVAQLTMVQLPNYPLLDRPRSLGRRRRHRPDRAVPPAHEQLLVIALALAVLAARKGSLAAAKVAAGFANDDGAGLRDARQ